MSQFVLRPGYRPILPSESQLQAQSHRSVSYKSQLPRRGWIYRDPFDCYLGLLRRLQLCITAPGLGLFLFFLFLFFFTAFPFLLGNSKSRRLIAYSKAAHQERLFLDCPRQLKQQSHPLYPALSPFLPAHSTRPGATRKYRRQDKHIIILVAPCCYFIYPSIRRSQCLFSFLLGLPKPRSASPRTFTLPHPPKGSKARPNFPEVELFSGPSITSLGLTFTRCRSIQQHPLSTAQHSAPLPVGRPPSLAISPDLPLQPVLSCSG